MTEEEQRDFVANYLEYLRWNRLPEQLPRTRHDAEAFLEKVRERAEANPFQDEAWDLFDATHEEPELAWQLLLSIVARLEDAELALLGAGDLETFVHLQATAFADRIEQQIRENRNFRKAFESVYIGSDTPAEAGRRFNTALREAGVAEEHIIDWWS